MNNELISIEEGTAGGVEFDFFGAWEYYKVKQPKDLLMVHTHPDDYLRMSPIDTNMLKGWMTAFPVPIYYAILAHTAETDKLFDSIVYVGYKGTIIQLGEFCKQPYILQLLYMWSTGFPSAKERLQERIGSRSFINLKEEIRVL